MRQNRKLYHKDVYFPDYSIFEVENMIGCRFSRHFKHYLYSPDKKHNISVLGIVSAVNRVSLEGELFELELTDGKVTKAVFRVPYDDENDISIVFRNRTIITAWLNQKTDTHTTLDRYKYTERGADESSKARNS